MTETTPTVTNGELTFKAFLQERDMQSKNLWGKIPEMNSLRTPHEILIEQGDFLSQLSNGLLGFEIERQQKSTLFSYVFSITIPSMNFRQSFLRITHDIKLFPSILRHEQSGEEYTSKGQDEFEEDLGSILSSAETKNFLSGLMAQAKLERQLAECGMVA
jgi:hypothetical protein